MGETVGAVGRVVVGVVGSTDGIAEGIVLGWRVGSETGCSDGKQEGVKEGEEVKFAADGAKVESTEEDGGIDGTRVDLSVVLRLGWLLGTPDDAVDGRFVG